ncbi:MAG: hypothetical protein EZS28_012252 [Streblomastix strix]|uniref:Uncharacterized protein n=1 Tax=Streblomastix strix TaxID=222440 RepID=A0A5J4WBF3_9EUKA|nr:MAG: hypothetical protein EZS28_012252 [Streblomastix strix]
MTNIRNDVVNFIDEPGINSQFKIIDSLDFIRMSQEIYRAMGAHLVILSNQTVNGTQYNGQEIGEEDF